MKFCEKCGKEINEEAVVCTNCGCAVENKTFKAKKVSYDAAVEKAATTNIISIIILAVAVVVWLFVNMWLGAILCLVAEFVALMPNSKLQKAIKQNEGSISDKKAFKAKAKEITKDLGSRYPAYKFSKILGIIALVLLIISLI